MILLKKLDKDYDPTNIFEAMRLLEEAELNRWLLTGILYIDPDEPDIFASYNLVDTPLNRLPESRLRPSRDTLEEINRQFSN